MATVWIPAQLRPLTAGQETIVVPGRTVRAVVEELERLHPGIRDRLCEGEKLRPGLVVAVGPEVSTLGLATPVAENSEVHFVPVIAGG